MNLVLQVNALRWWGDGEGEDESDSDGDSEGEDDSEDEDNSEDEDDSEGEDDNTVRMIVREMIVMMRAVVMVPMYRKCLVYLILKR